jgi:small subunit ribosomal protein S21
VAARRIGEAIRRARKLARKQMIREGLIAAPKKKPEAPRRRPTAAGEAATHAGSAE